jgi:putative PIN family toxin of toxin-antitoxin system
MTQAPPRVVMDCMIFLQAAARPSGPAAACIELVERGYIELFLSRVVLKEIEGTLAKPSLQAKFKSLTEAAIRRNLERWAEYGIMVENVPEVFRYPRDADDEPYINLAIAAGADYLVSRDRDLLDLMDESTPEGKDFRGRFPGLNIIEPVAFLRALADAAR